MSYRPKPDARGNYRSPTEDRGLALFCPPPAYGYDGVVFPEPETQRFILARDAVYAIPWHRTPQGSDYWLRVWENLHALTDHS